MSATPVPMVRFPTAALDALHRAAGRGRDAHEAARLVREIGLETGETFHSAFQEWLAQRGEPLPVAALPADRFWSGLAEFFSSLGWGRLEEERPHPGVVSLSSDEWVESAEKSGAAHPACHLTTGLLADLLGRVAGEDLAVLEVECQATGAGRCRFLVGSDAVLQRVHEEIARGAAYPDALATLG